MALERTHATGGFIKLVFMFAKFPTLQQIRVQIPETWTVELKAHFRDIIRETETKVVPTGRGFSVEYSSNSSIHTNNKSVIGIIVRKGAELTIAMLAVSARVRPPRLHVNPYNLRSARL